MGSTPLVKLRRSTQSIPTPQWLKKRGFNEPRFSIRGTLLAKVEFFNPGGSVKDRIARNIVDQAEKKGLLKPGGTLVEATSGNTGAGLAVVAAARGYKAIFVMSDKMSAEKVNALRAFGARVVITPNAVHPDSPLYYCNVAKKIARETPGAFLADQYFNEDNPKAHELTTGPEIWEQTSGDLDFFAAGIGTGGTLSGTARFLKNKSPGLDIVAIDPVGSIYESAIKTKKIGEMTPYLVEGVGEDMIPGTMDMNLPTEVVTVNDVEAFAATRMLAQMEGILVGGSCGMAFLGAAQFMALKEKQLGRPLRGVVLLPDSGSRYLSKIFNPSWLNERKVNSAWGDLPLGGDVEFLPEAIRIPGV